ncbi:MAG TPA: bifunctional 5,10-methylenetetrahydrofolate dehydrogenase/5,10-methenyltetrahydrofolate cyclohydrolase, partial [Thermomicrobiales bacterium]|nr:bifunctional 5,10-methylenetetrahydrofolate dehydrogenase/5,10-methenyltetrahydrofolate cyclohydrolase [Thermomicrobiales bacterium]
RASAAPPLQPRGGARDVALGQREGSDRMSGARPLRGAPVAKRIRAEAAAAAATFEELTGARPSLVTLQVGADPSASAYRDAIRRSVIAVGIRHQHLGLPVDASPADLLAAIEALNHSPQVHGVLVLMPLPPQLGTDLVLEQLSPLKDVDGITPTNAGRLYLGLPSLRPSTPQGGLELLDFYGVPIARRRAAVIGRSPVVGRPLAMLLLQRDATVTICHRATPDLAAITRAADIVAVAAGCPGLLTGAMLRPGAVVLDFGVTVVDAHLVGDAEEASVAAVASAYTPVPGGAGPVTTAVLARNTVAAAFASLHGTLDESDASSAASPAVADASG